MSHSDHNLSTIGIKRRDKIEILITLMQRIQASCHSKNKSIDEAVYSIKKKTLIKQLKKKLKNQFKDKASLDNEVNIRVNDMISKMKASHEDSNSRKRLLFYRDISVTINSSGAEKTKLLDFFRNNQDFYFSKIVKPKDLSEFIALLLK